MTAAATRAFRHRTRLTCLVYRITGTWADAEDAVDEAFARLVALSEEPAEATAWLAVVATRLGIDRVRKQGRDQYVGPWLPEPVDLDPLPEDEVVRADELRMAVLVAYQMLSPHERAALVLREGFALPYEEIASALEVTAATARQWVRRARVRLAGGLHGSRPPTEGQVEALVQAVLSGDVDRVAGLLAEDVRLSSDGGGRVSAALRVIAEPRKCAYFLVKTAEGGSHEFAQTRIGGEDAVAVRSAGVVRVIQFYTGPQGVSNVYFHCNPDKLTRIPLPEGWVPG